MRIAIVVAAALAVAVISRLGFLSAPFLNDAGIYIYMGKIVAGGGRLYQDFYETKFPTVGLLIAPLYWFFGAHWISYVLFQLALALIAPWILARAAGRSVGKWTFLPTLLAGLVLLNCSRIVLTGFQLETIQAVAAMGSASAVLFGLARWRAGFWLLAGIAAGLAALLKPTGLAVAGAAGVALLYSFRYESAKRVLLSLVALSTGVAIVVAPALLWMLAGPLRKDLPELFQQIALYGQATPWKAVFSIKTAIFVVLPLLPVVIRIGWILCFDRSRAGAAHVRVFAPITCFAVVWLLAEIAGVVAQRRCYSYHFLVLAPPAALIFGLLPAPPKLLAICASLLPIAVISLGYSLPMYRQINQLRLSPVSRYVQEHTNRADAVWADPAAQLLLETGRKPGARLPHLFVFVNYDEAPDHYLDVLLADFESRRPKYLVFQANHKDKIQRQMDDTPGLIQSPRRMARFRSAWGRLDRYIKDQYVQETTIDGRVIYRRQGT